MFKSEERGLKVLPFCCKKGRIAYSERAATVAAADIEYGEFTGGTQSVSQRTVRYCCCGGELRDRDEKNKVSRQVSGLSSVRLSSVGIL